MLRVSRYLTLILVFLTVLFFSISIYGPWSVYTSGSSIAEGLYVACVFLTVVAGILVYLIASQEYEAQPTRIRRYYTVRASTVIMMIILLIVVAALSGIYAALAKVTGIV